MHSAISPLVYDALLLSAAVLLDRLIGDPEGFPHPVRLVGWLITRIESLLYGTGTFAAGAALAFFTVAITVAAVHAALALTSPMPVLRALIQIYLLYTVIAWRSLKDESALVADSLLRSDIQGARHSLSRIVGRDTAELDEPAIVRAAVETVGENAVDGVFAPLFYIVLGSLLGCPTEIVWAFKAVSTLDSMVGYRNERYRNFGTASARLDDALNFIPARLGALFMLLGAWFPHRRIARNVAVGIWRDRKKHASPNSAHGESAMAWLLGIQLGGQASYGGAVSMKPTLGVAAREPEAADIARAHSVMDRGISLFLLACLLVLVYCTSGSGA